MRKIGVAALAATFMSATAASAAVYTATTTGVIGYGVDWYDLMGLGQVLTGLPYIEAVTFDTANIRNEGFFFFGGQNHTLYAGTGQLALTIEGQTFTSTVDFESFNDLGRGDTLQDISFSIPGGSVIGGPFGLDLRNTSNVSQGKIQFGIPGAFTQDPNFDASTLPTAVVPEPEAWSLLITGFFGLGAALRTARRVRRAA